MAENNGVPSKALDVDLDDARLRHLRATDPAVSDLIGELRDANPDFARRSALTSQSAPTNTADTTSVVFEPHTVGGGAGRAVLAEPLDGDGTGRCGAGVSGVTPEAAVILSYNKKRCVRECAC